MGGSSSKFKDNSWAFKHRLAEFYDIYDNGHGLLAEKHIVENNPAINQNSQMEIYHYRSQTNKPIVNVYNAEYQQSNKVCGNHQNISVYCEYIPYRLTEVIKLNYGQALYVLSQSLAGFHQLYQKVGAFPITDAHIGFNDQGKVKVWYNTNWASNHLQQNPILLMSTKNPKDFDTLMADKQEQDMVQDIWISVANHSAPNTFPAIFRQYTNDFKQIKFLEARQKVAEAIQEDKLYVPSKLNFEPKIHESRSEVRQFPQK